MTAALILIFLFLFLFLLSRTLTRSISGFILQIIRRQSASVYTLAILFFPGTLIHEIAHFLMARILFVWAGNMVLLPKLEGHSVRLGSVAIQKTDPIRRMLIGVAPFLVGSSILFFLLLFATNQSFPILSLPMLGIGYAVFEIGNTMFSSRKDLEGVIELLLAVLVLGILLYIAGFRPPESLLDFLNSQKMISLFQRGSVLLTIPIILDLVIIFILQLLRKFLYR